MKLQGSVTVTVPTALEVQTYPMLIGEEEGSARGEPRVFPCENVTHEHSVAWLAKATGQGAFPWAWPKIYLVMGSGVFTYTGGSPSFL